MIEWETGTPKVAGLYLCKFPYGIYSVETYMKYVTPTGKVVELWNLQEEHAMFGSPDKFALIEERPC